jgi:hypothetical protein
MAWTVFGALTTPTLPQLDANFAILTALGPISCTIGGTAGALVLTPINTASPIAAYQQNMPFVGIAAHNNTFTATASVTGIVGTLPIYKDTVSGPVQLSGAGPEIVTGNIILLWFDQALNSNAGGFHLWSQHW